MKQKLFIGIAVVLVLLVVLGASPFFILDLTQTAIVVQLGKPKRTVTEPGLKFKVPFVQEVRYFDKRLLDYDVAAREVITQDKKTILIDNFAKWKIVDPLEVYKAFQTQRGALQRLDDIIYSELRVELGRHELSGNCLREPFVDHVRGRQTRQSKSLEIRFGSPGRPNQTRGPA